MGRASPLCDQHEGIVNLERFGSDEPLSVAYTDRYATSASDRYQRIDKVITLRLGIVELRMVAFQHFHPLIDVIRISTTNEGDISLGYK